jgi:UDP-GlcNAc:undecaprenyl-phosphate GlcNAc-1-phosphate transferase
MEQLPLIFAAALVVAILATPVMRRVALRYRLLDQPSGRKLHARPIPLLGGLAIFAAVLAGMVIYRSRAELVELAVILVGATWISLWGLWDDRSGLRALSKLLAQAAAATALVVAGVHVSLPIPMWANLLLSFLWIVGITNAFNLLDNMDGLSAGIGATSAAYFLLLAALNGQYLVGALAAALLGACLGFVFYNFNPARIFMGDSGSLFLGFMMAVVGIKLRFPEHPNTITWMVPLLVLFVPLFDTTLVVVSRLRRGKNPFTTPGKDHVSHRLVEMGWSRREAVLVLFLTSCAAGGIAIFVSVAQFVTAYAVVGAVLAGAIVGMVWLELRSDSAAPAPTEAP